MTCGRWVLLVDDDILVLAAMRRQARLAGVAVRCVQRGDEALALLEEPGLAGVVTDFRMPQMDGAALLGEIARRCPALPCALYTGEAHLHAELPKRTLVVHKPAREGELEAVLQEMIAAP
jgi:DNA-binding NtrC family response regulator